MVDRTAPAGPGRPIAVHASSRGGAMLDAVTPALVEALAPEAVGLDASTYARLNADLHTVLAALEA